MGRQTETLAADAKSQLPYALTGAALVAFAGLFITGERFLGLPIMAVLLVGSYATHWRLVPKGTLRWMLRLVVFTTITMIVGMPRQEISLWYMKPEYTNLVGYLLSAELVLRAWIRPEPARRRQRNGIVLFLSALIMTAASNTYDRQPTQTLGPIYMLLVAFSLRSLGSAEQSDVPPKPRRSVLAALLALRGAALVLAMTLGFSVVFMLTRYENKLSNWAMQFLRQDKTTKGSSIGLNSAPHLRRVFNPQPSMERILTIDGSATENHLRVMEFDEYKERQWGPGAPQRTFIAIDPKRLDTHQAGQRLQFKVLIDADDMLAIPANASMIESPVALDIDQIGSLRDHDPIIHPSYAVVVPPAQEFVPLAASPDDSQRARALVVPPTIDPKIIELSRQVAGDVPPIARIQRIQQYLRSHHEYSLSYDPATDEPLNDFLLNRRAAHCQYFASAVVVMARAVGVPARLVTGYYAHERFGDEQLIVRDRDAHAWAECWIEGQGWLTVDATPSGGRPDVAFDEASKWRQWWEWFTDLPGRFRQWLAQMPRQTLVMLIVALTAIAVAIWIWRAARKRRRVSRAVEGGYAAPSAELAAAARRFEQWLGRHDLPCAPSRTWREHLAALNPTLLLPLETCLQFIESYDRARFGGAAQVLSQLHAALDHLERSPARPGSTQHG